jgi:molybdate transport system substrate-binding protein
MVGALLVSGLIVSTDSVAQPDDEQVTITVSAAADLLYAFEDLGARFTAETGIRIDFNFGSTGQLTHQIEAGAPVDVFAAANIAFIDQLSEQGLTIADTEALYARGRIVVWQLPNANVLVEAIANPEHAPYGMAAREALITIGIWDAIQHKVVFGENIADTLRYGETGNVDVAIVALSLALLTEGRWFLIEESLHEPIDQALAVIAGTEHEEAARAFAAFVNSETGREIMRRNGFVLPGEAPFDVQTSGTPAASATPQG